MVVTKTRELTVKEVKNLMNEVVELLENTFENEGTPSPTPFEKLFTKNFQLTSNGAVRCRNLTEYLQRFTHLQERYETVEFSGPIEEPVVSGNQFSIYQTINLTPREGKRTKVLVMATATVEQGKLASWIQVAHLAGNEEWDK